MVARSRDWRRRMAVLIVMLIAAAATIATSQPIVQSRLERSAEATVVLDDASPRAVGQFVLTLSLETLPVGTATAPAPDGDVTFTIAVDGGAGVGARSGEAVSITASAVGIPQPPLTVSGNPTWPIEELCRVAEPCRREFEVAVEWLQPEPGKSLEVSVKAALALVYNEQESLPAGANATWESGAFEAVAPAPALSADADLGRITLSRESPLAVRHVLLSGSADTFDESGDVDVTAYLRAEPLLLYPQGALVTVTLDAAEGQAPLGPGAFFSPFVGCPHAQTCVRGLTIVARWTGLAPENRVDLDWSIEAVARFRGAASVPEGAALTVEVDDRLDLGPDSPRLHAEAEGSFDTPVGDGETARLRFEVIGPALGDAFLGENPPAVAVLRFSAALENPSEPGLLDAIVSARGSPGAVSLPIPDDGSDAQLVAFPFAECATPIRCEGSINVTIGSRADRSATITWHVTIDLPVPRPELTEGRLTVELVDGP